MTSSIRTVLAVLFVCLLVPPLAAEPIQVATPHAILLDSATGTVLYERGADDLVPPAATSKIMTAELIFSMLKAGKLRPDQLFTISETAWRQGGAPSHGSTMFAKVHSQISVDDLLHGLIVDGANDAAIALAEGTVGSQGAFATLMTKRARELGFDKLTFTDAWGDANPAQRVTARQMAELANEVIRTYPDLYRIFGQRDFLWNKIKQPNRNPLLAADIGADGLKTGNLEDGSGFSIVGSAVQNGERLVVALYGSKSASERADDARKLLQWGFRNFETRSLYAAGDTIGSARVYGGESRGVPLVTRTPLSVLVPRDGQEHLSAKIVYQGPLTAPVRKDAEVATLRIYKGDAAIFSTPLYAGRDVAVGSLPNRALDAGLEYVGGLFRKYVLRS